MSSTKTKTDYNLPEKLQATTLESVKFIDGMVVTAEDLQAATDYPTSMLQTVMRTYFGCGVMAGLGLKPDDKEGTRDTFELCVEAGMAVDAHGFPLELCRPIKLNLTPDPCIPESEAPTEVCILVRRVTSDEAPRDAAECKTTEPQFECSRTRNHILVKAFAVEDLPQRGLCEIPPTPEPVEGKPPAVEPTPEASTTDSVLAELCDCLTKRLTPDAAAESWVMLGCVKLKPEGIESVDLSRRQFVRPTQCVCDVTKKLAEFGARMEQMERTLMPPSTPPATPAAAPATSTPPPVEPAE